MYVGRFKRVFRGHIRLGLIGTHSVPRVENEMEAGIKEWFVRFRARWRVSQVQPCNIL